MKKGILLRKELQVKKSAVICMAAALLSGCVSSETAPESVKQDNSGMLARGGSMIEAFQKNDYQFFAAQFGGQIPDGFGEKEFDSAIKQMSTRAGAVTSSRFLGELSGPVFTTWLWAVNFEKEGKDSKKISQEMIFKVVAGKLDGKMQIVSFGFLI